MRNPFKKKEKLEYEAPKVTPEVQALLASMQNAQMPSFLKDDNMYQTLLKLFDPKILYMITDLDDETIKTMTRHNTLYQSCKTLYHLKDEDMPNVIPTMHDSYATLRISRKRKSRVEVTDTLKGNVVTEHTRTLGDKFLGRR